MFRWLTKLGRSSRARPAREVLLNEALELAMDWGESWLAPIQERLRQQRRYLRREELDELNAACQEAMKLGHETAYALVRSRGKHATQDEFLAIVLARHPWLTAENSARLFKQSMYYAWKTGGPPRA
jgi:hypothetical protein